MGESGGTHGVYIWCYGGVITVVAWGLDVHLVEVLDGTVSLVAVHHDESFAVWFGGFLGHL